MCADTSAPSTVRRVLDAAGQSAGGELRLLLHGDEFDTWAVGSELVVKFPRSPDMADKLRREVQFAGSLRRRLGDLVPLIRFASDGTDEFPMPFLGYERALGIQGQAPDGAVVRSSDRASSDLARDVARILAIVHSIPIAEAVASGLLEDLEPLADRRPSLSASVVDLATAFAGNSIDRFLDEPPPRYDGELTTCHADVKGEHVFLAPSLDRVTSLIDWADAAIMDPAEDLAGLVGWLGTSFVREVADAGPWPAGTTERAIFRAREGLLAYLLAVERGDEGGAPPGLLPALLRTAFSD